jgi:hypothetical protein
VGGVLIALLLVVLARSGGASDAGPEVRLARGQEVGLGCGTLVLIALIVWLLSGRSVRDLEVQVFQLRSEIGKLVTAVEAQSAELRQLRDRLPPPAKPADEKEK